MMRFALNNSYEQPQRQQQQQAVLNFGPPPWAGLANLRHDSWRIVSKHIQKRLWEHVCVCVCAIVHATSDWHTQL